MLWISLGLCFPRATLGALAWKCHARGRGVRAAERFLNIVGEQFFCIDGLMLAVHGRQFCAENADAISAPENLVAAVALGSRKRPA